MSRGRGRDPHPRDNLDGDRPDTTWQDDAACHDADPELFAVDHDQQLAEAVIHRWCVSCPVIERCRRYAQQTSSVGVWGGELRLMSKTVTLPQLQTRAHRATVDGGRFARGPCGVCGRDVALNAAGRARPHHNTTAACPGVGHPPARAA